MQCPNDDGDEHRFLYQRDGFRIERPESGGVHT